MTGGTWFHCSKTVVARSKGRSVVAAAAYRTGLALMDEREQTLHDYTRKHGVAEVFVTTPEGVGNSLWAHDIARLVNAMEAHEKRKDAQVAHEWTIALPAALDEAEQSALSHRISQALSEMYRVPVIAARHEPGREGDERNDHLHLLFPTRELAEADGKLGAKITAITGLKSGPQEVKRFRECVAGLINEALEDSGSDERVDARSFAARGIDAAATTHLGPSATAIERRGMRSERGDLNRQIIADRLAEQDADAREIRDELEWQWKGRFVDAGQPGNAQQSDEEAAREIRGGTPFPTDAGEWLARHYRPMSTDLGDIARNPPPPPAGWLARMRHVAEHMAEVWHEEASDNPSLDRGRGGMLLHVARVLKHVLHRDEEKTEEPEPDTTKAPESFTDRLVQSARDILSNERGATPAPDRFEAWCNVMREHLGEWMHPHDWHEQDGHEMDGPEHDTGPDMDIER